MHPCTGAGARAARARAGIGAREAARGRVVPIAVTLGIYTWNGTPRRTRSSLAIIQFAGNESRVQRAACQAAHWRATPGPRQRGVGSC